MAGGAEGFFSYRGISAERLSVSIAKETAASIVSAAAMPTTTTIKSVRMIPTPVSPALKAKDGHFGICTVTKRRLCLRIGSQWHYSRGVDWWISQPVI
jgi:hypothetical protein